jgi:DNA replication protein DnaC
MDIDFVSPSGFRSDGHPSLPAAATFTNRFCNRYITNDATKGRWRVLGGNVGCGKTMLARVIFRVSVSATTAKMAKEARKSNFSLETSWIKWIEYGSDEMKDADFNEYMRNSVAKATLIIIDDIGVEEDRYKSGVGRSRLMRVLEQAERKWLFATTNILPDDYLRRYDERVSSRLRGAVSMWNDAPDYRLIKKEACA